MAKKQLFSIALSQPSRYELRGFLVVKKHFKAGCRCVMGRRVVTGLAEEGLVGNDGIR